MGFGKLLCLALILSAQLTAQAIFGPDEVRARSSPYVPPPPPNTMKAEVNLVEVPVVARDGKRRTVPGLKPSDFEVFDLGKKQEITSFSVEGEAVAPADTTADGVKPATPAPSLAAETPRRRFITLCFDSLNTRFADLRSIKTAAARFVRTALDPGDRVAVVNTAFATSLDFTNDVTRLLQAIENINPQQRFSDDVSSCPRITGYQAYLITNSLDADTLEGVTQEDMVCKNIRHPQAVQDVTSLAHLIWEQALNNSSNTLYTIGNLVDVMRKLPGRRMLLLASSGFLSGNLEYRLDELTTKAMHAEVVINSLDAKGLYTIVPGRPIDAPPTRGRPIKTQLAESSIQSRQASAQDDGMAVLALGTGGAFYHNSNDIDKGFRELATIPDLVYVLGFSPSDSIRNGRYHALKVRPASGRHFSLQARMGYTAPTKAPTVELRPPSKLDNAVLSPETLTGVPVTFIPLAGPPGNGNPSITVAMHFDIAQLKFDSSGERRSLKLAFLITICDKGGSFVAGRQGEIELALKPSTYENLTTDGLNITMPISVPAGNYSLRGVVQEGIDGKLSASTLPIELR